MLNSRLSTFFSEPHLLGKIRWLSVGTAGMTRKDYFDVLFHGFPFVLLISLIILKLKKQDSKTPTK
jgi:hypothetical protein